MFRKLTLAALTAAGVLAMSAGASEAAQGCGPGFHRGLYGACRPNFGPGFGYGYGYGWHRPWGYWHRGWGWRRHWY